MQKRLLNLALGGLLTLGSTCAALAQTPLPRPLIRIKLDLPHKTWAVAACAWIPTGSLNASPANST